MRQRTYPVLRGQEVKNYILNLPLVQEFYRSSLVKSTYALGTYTLGSIYAAISVYIDTPGLANNYNLFMVVCVDKKTAPD